MTTEERLEKLEKKVRRLLIGGGGLVVLLMGACTSGAAIRDDGKGGIKVQSPTYEVLLSQYSCDFCDYEEDSPCISWERYPDPIDIRALVEQFPEIRGIVMTAPEYIDEYDRKKRESDALGRKLIPEADLKGTEVLIYGAVMKRENPRVPYRRGLTLLSAIGFVGLEKNSEWRQIRVIRRRSVDGLRKSRVIICDLWNYFAYADVRQDIPLFPGDVVVVPERLPDVDQPEHSEDLEEPEDLEDPEDP